MKKGKIEMQSEKLARTPHVPRALRAKWFTTRVSNEIFFIDSLNDLNCCRNVKSSYHLIRAAGILRTLMDGGINIIAKNYSFQLEYTATDKHLEGEPLSGNTIRTKDKFKELFAEAHVASIDYLRLTNDSNKIYTPEDFLNKVCYQYKFGNTTINISADNLIMIMSNKHGPSHFADYFDSDELHAFHMHEFNPYSICEGHRYLNTILEIINILLDAIKPLAILVVEHLHEYNRKYLKHSHTQFFPVEPNPKEK